MRHIFVPLIAVFLWAACSGCSSCDPAPIEVKNLTEELFTPKTEEEARQLLQEYPQALRALYPKLGASGDTAGLVRDILHTNQDPYADTLRRATQAFWQDKEQSLREDLACAFGNFQEHYPDSSLPKIYLYTHSYKQSLQAFPEVVLIALDWYMGEERPYRPAPRNIMPDYILARHKPKYLVPQVMWRYGENFTPEFQGRENMMTDMLSWGKIYYFAEKMLPDTPDSLIIGYTKPQMQWMQQNQEQVWAYFVKNKMFFEHSYRIRARFVNEAPFISQFGKDSPGRVGQWLGWQIIRAYAEQHSLSLREVMAETDPRKIFDKSGFKPA